MIPNISVYIAANTEAYGHYAANVIQMPQIMQAFHVLTVMNTPRPPGIQLTKGNPDMSIIVSTVIHVIQKSKVSYR